MIECICTKQTIHNGRLYKPGDTEHFPGQPPRWFEPIDGPVVVEPLPIVSGGSVALLADGPSGRDYRELPYPVAAVNRAGVRYRGDLTYWITMHPQYLERWLLQRSLAGKSVEGIRFVSHELVREPAVSLFTDAPVQGSSALLAFMALEAMGYDHIHLVGVDLSGPYQIFREAWNAYPPRVHVTTNDLMVGYRR